MVGYLIGDAAKAQISDANPALFLAMGIFAIVISSYCSVCKFRNRIWFRIDEAKTPDKHSALSFRHFILGAIAIFLYVGVEVGIPNFMNLFATSSEIGIDPTVAKFFIYKVGTYYWFLMMIGRLFGASFGAKISSKAMLSSATSGSRMIFILIAIFALCYD